VEVIYYHPPMKISNENDEIESLARSYRRQGYTVIKNVPLPYGFVDLAVITPKKDLILLEVKMQSGVNDVAHALGQLLLYREQIDKTKFGKILYVIHCFEQIPYETFLSLQKICAKHDVELNVPQPYKGDQDE